MPTPARRVRPARVLVRALVATAGLAVIGGIAYAALTSDDASRAGAMAPTLELARAQTMSFDISTTAAGELQAKNQIEIRNKLEQQSTIIEIIEEGKQVKKGEVLIRLQSDEIQTQIDQELLQVESAKAEEIAARESLGIQESENESALRDARLKLDLAELDLKKWEEGEVRSKRQELSLALERANRELQRLEDKFIQTKRLLEENFVSRDEYRREELQVIEARDAKAKAELASRVYEEFEHPRAEKEKRSAVEEATANLERVERKNASELASKQANLENRRRQRILREDRLKKLQEQLANTTLIAPSDGLVVYSTSMERSGWGGGDGPLQIGRKTYPNELLIALPDTSQMIASVQVPESLASRVRPGLPASVKVEAAGGKTFTGTVSSIGVLAESGGWRDPNRREYTVKIDLASIDGADLKPSMRAEAELRLGRVEEALAVPLQAVFNEGPLRYVYVTEGARYVRRPVQVGRRSERFAEIREGLEPGTQVLLRQPRAGEVYNRPWDAAQLAAVGLKLDEQGKVVPAEGGRGGRPDGAGGARAGGRPRGSTEATTQAAPAEGQTVAAATAEVKPASTEQTTTASQDGATPNNTTPEKPKPAGS